MSPKSLLEDLSSRGVHLMVEGERLAYDAPRGVLTEADRAALKAYKAELLAMVETAAQEANKCQPSPHAQKRAEKCRLLQDPPPPAAQDPDQFPRHFTPPPPVAHTCARETTENSGLPEDPPPPPRVYSNTIFGRITVEPCTTPGYRAFKSELLQDLIMLADVDRPEDAEPEPLVVVYTRAETALMKELPPADVKAIHEMKTEWGGRYTGPAEPWPPAGDGEDLPPAVAPLL